MTKPVVIAGPCSAESEQQIFETAKALRVAGIEVLRAEFGSPVLVRIVLKGLEQSDCNGCSGCSVNWE